MADTDQLPYRGPNLPVITLGNPANDPNVDPHAGMFGDAPPKDDVASPSIAPGGSDADQMFGDKPPADDKPHRAIGSAEAGVKGLGNALTFGTMPAIAGLSAASGIPSAATNDDEVDLNPVRPIMGAVKMLHEYLSDHPDPAVREAYDKGRKAQLNDEDQSAEQHLGPYLVGQLAGSLLTPLGTVGTASKAASAAANVGRASIGGAVGGAFYGAGGAVGEGKGIVDTGIGAAKGALTGAALGGLGSGVVEGVGNVVKKIGSIVKGKTDPETEQARRVWQALQSDFDQNGASISQEESAAGRAARTPTAIIDSGGESTRALAEWAATTSPKARSVLKGYLEPRYEQQGGRVSGAIRQLAGGAHAAQDQEALERAARLHNKPAYDKLMNKYPVVSVPPAITDRPVVGQAMKDAVSLAQNHGEKLSAEPEVKTILKGPGYHIADDVPNPAKTSLRYWDYVKKALDARIEGMKRSGGIERLNGKEAADFAGLNDARAALVEHLDHVAPEYKATRQGAAAFFKAENASEAGQKFVTEEFNEYGAKRALAKFNPHEREMFARAFASDLADKIAKTSFSGNVIKSAFLNNKSAVDKIHLALGAQRANQLEALLRIEKIVAEPMEILHGSPTARRLMEVMGATSGVGIIEGIKDHEFDASQIIPAIIGGLIVGGLHHTVKVVDEKAALGIAKLLISRDPAALAKGIKIVTARPAVMNALRMVTSGSARVAAHDAGPNRVGAAAAAGALRVLDGPEQAEHTSPADNAADQAQQ
jgi:hypothetical protein